ncbi:MULTISPECIES: RNA polymerase sigma factor [Ralstonia solanacearum species complex]|uniref:RNA polymerase sigma factor n=1 Tax=Ralstonia solanacearum species complex TaxID=3116862 RepID=UPI000E57EA59|nr:RNA polymerase sigma factor [Ralstonia solanacearum]AXV77066.1 RNA polymerase subunit sigma [Ralstonia solanacearum]AXV91083.1 RNA polymerase subunit sigma [Ralstonia solanacearum]AXW19227.1 RNA polymerase subunit sigma [Ralstonia solanacearum]AXW75992.1 RNA polymerase subunit sigma [Ralstonia solanacearum]
MGKREEGAVNLTEESSRFAEVMLPHLNAAYNLARWLSGSATDADDIVQEAYLRAFRFFGSFHGGNARAWLLAIVRNTWFSEWRRRCDAADGTPFDEVLHGDERLPGWVDDVGSDPETLAVRRDDAHLVHRALEQLPVEYREVLVLRELEEMSYRDIASIACIPIGTVMSRLARGRHLLCTAVRAAQMRGQDGRIPPAPMPMPSRSMGANHGR